MGESVVVVVVAVVMVVAVVVVVVVVSVEGMLLDATRDDALTLKTGPT